MYILLTPTGRPVMRTLTDDFDKCILMAMDLPQSFTEHGKIVEAEWRRNKYEENELYIRENKVWVALATD